MRAVSEAKVEASVIGQESVSAAEWDSAEPASSDCRAELVWVSASISMAAPWVLAIWEARAAARKRDRFILGCWSSRLSLK